MELIYYMCKNTADNSILPMHLGNLPAKTQFFQKEKPISFGIYANSSTEFVFYICQIICISHDFVHLAADQLHPCEVLLALYFLYVYSKASLIFFTFSCS